MSRVPTTLEGREEEQGNDTDAFKAFDDDDSWTMT